MRVVLVLVFLELDEAKDRMSKAIATNYANRGHLRPECIEGVIYFLHTGGWL